MRSLVLLLFALFPAAAQITSLATDATGSTLLIATPFRLQSEPELGNQYKIYRWRNDVWTRLGLAQTSSISGEVFFGLFTAAGGQVYGWHVRPLITGPSFIARPTGRADVYGIVLPSGFPRESVTVSPNGRYAAGVSLINLSGPILQGEIFDARTGSRTVVPYPVSDISIASDGTHARSTAGTTAAGQVIVESPGREPLIVAADGLYQLSDDARWLTVRRSNGAILVATADASETPLPESTLIALSNTRLLYVPSARSTDLMEFDLLTHQATLLHSFSRPATKLALSADGSVAWVLTEQGRLARISFPARGVEEILPPLGFSTTGGASAVRGSRVPGSAVLLPGVFTREQQVFVDNEPFPLSDVNAEGYWFQVPWEWNGRGQPPLHELTMRSPGNPFEMLTGFANDGPYWPHFPTLREPSTNLGTMIIAAHEDYSALVTPSNPARAGEKIHVYMTGLGALARPVATGAPGPANGVPIAGAFSCTGSALGSQERTPTAATAFYAPTMIGIYVVELIVPDDVPDGPWGLRCGDAEKMPFGWTFTRPVGQASACRPISSSSC